MRLFQNSGLYRAYVPRLNALAADNDSFDGRVSAFLGDRFGAPHFLLPVLERAPEAFFANGDDEIGQRAWAREHGLPHDCPLDRILLAQIEEHRTEVFYNMDPMRFASDFVRRLPGCVRKSIAWRAAPSPGADFAAYDLVICNFPTILESYRRAGWKAAYFAPGHDPAMDEFAGVRSRPIDVLFVGGYSRHHRRRAQLLEAVASRGRSHRVVMHLDRSRATRWAESWIGQLLPLSAHRRPASIRRVAREPIFGRDLYAALAQAKIVVNGAIDMAGNDRGNMRCFEAMGCGCTLLSDDGQYPQGMDPGRTLVTYADASDALGKLDALLAEPERQAEIARAGYEMVSSQYSKQSQWQRFQDLAQ